MTGMVGKSATRAWKNGGKSESSRGGREMMMLVVVVDFSRCGLERWDGRPVSGLFVPPKAEDSEMADRRLFLALPVGALTRCPLTEGTTTSGCFPKQCFNVPS